MELEAKVMGRDGRIRYQTFKLEAKDGGELRELSLFLVSSEGVRMPVVVTPFINHGTGLHTMCRGPEDPTLFTVESE